MTENHPITPPKHLLSHWQEVINYGYSPERIEEMLTEAARWGSDQELEACLEEIRDGAGRIYIDKFKLRTCLADDIWTARRPKPKSQADGALILLDDVSDRLDAPHENGIRRALERLRELEDSNPKLPTPVVNEPPISFVFEGTRYTRADLVSSGDKDWGKHLVIGGVEYFPL